MKANEKEVLTVVGHDPVNGPAAVVGPCSWVSSNPAVATVTPVDAQGLTANLVGVAAGTTTITVTDATSGLSGTLNVSVDAVAPVLASVTIDEGAPTPQ